MSDYPLESFVFYRSFRDAVEEMADESKLATLLAICDYALYGVEPTLKDAMARAVFTVVRPNIDANLGKRANGKKGGRPKKKTDGSYEENHRFSKSESTETETETETETGTGTETETETGTEASSAAAPPVPPGETGKPARRKYGQYGWVKLTDEEYSRLSNDFGEAEVKRCIAYVDESAQASGNKNHWRDWNLVLRRCHRDGWGLSARGRSHAGATPGADLQPNPGRIQKNADWLDGFLAEQEGRKPDTTGKEAGE